MNPQEQRAILTVCLMAAYADGTKHDREREHIQRVAQSLAAGSGIDVSLLREVLIDRRPLDDVARDLPARELRQLAYELAVGVCDADGAHSDGEARFLESLRLAFALDRGEAGAFRAAADALAETPLAEKPPSGTGPVVRAQPVDAAALDRSILQHAILTGALELLPQTLASMAIIPLQMKMVYAIGKAHGYELDRGHIKDLLATVGVGLTSQYVEEIGRKLVGGLLRRVGGRIAGGLGSQAAGSAMSFATTYALGHVAKAYYGAGRTLDAERLKEVFRTMVAEGQAARARNEALIEQKARTLDTGRLLELVRQPLG